MLNENKFSKYLIYAIGEILLVVVGILIALSINNWNESVKTKTLEKQLINLLLTDLREKRKENISDYADAQLFINNFQPTIDTWEKEKKIDTTNLKMNLRRIGADLYFLNGTSPIYSGVSTSILWKGMPNSLTEQIDNVYRRKLEGVKIVIDKTAEHATHCKLNFLLPNNLIDLNQSNELILERMVDVNQEFISYSKLFVSSCKSLARSLKISETGITKLIADLESYNKTKN